MNEKSKETISVKKKENNRNTIKGLKRYFKDEKYFSIIIIVIILISNIGIYFYLKPNLRRTFFANSQIGFYLDGPKYGFIGYRYRLDNPTFSIIDSNYNSYYSARMEEKGVYNNYYVYLCNFSHATHLLPKGIPLYLYSEYDGKRGEPFVINDTIFTLDKLEILLTFLKAQRCGVNSEGYHKECHLSDGADINKNLTGGWHDAGDYNKYSLNTAYTLFLLLESYSEFIDLSNKSGYEFNERTSDLDFNNNSQNDLLEEILFGFDWLLKMQELNKSSNEYGGVYDKISSGFLYWGAPENELTQRITYKEAYTGTAAAFSAVCAMGSRVFKSINQTFSDKLLNSSRLAYNFMLKNLTNFQPFKFGEYPGSNTTIGWAAAELFKTTNESKYLPLAIKYLPFNETTSKHISYWSYAGLRGLYTLFGCVNSSIDYEIMRTLILNYNNVEYILCNNPFGVPHRTSTGWGVNNQILGHIRDIYKMGVFLNKFQNETLPKLDKNKYPWEFENISMEKIRNEMFYDFNWLIGSNPWQISFITGLGTRNPNFPYTRMDREIPGGVVPGAIVYQTNMSHYVIAGNKLQSNWKYHEYTIDTNAMAIYDYLVLIKLFETLQK